MPHNWRKILPEYALLFAVIFAYRFAFRDDFEVSEMAQMSLAALLDVIVIGLGFSLINFVESRIHGLKRKWLLNALLILSIVTIYAAGVNLLFHIHYFIYKFTTGITEQFEPVFNSLSYQIFDSYIVLAVGMISLTGFRLYRKWLDQRIITERIEKERTRAELDYLKAQINPHFVFNTLNNLYFLVDESNEDARKLIHEFSDILRYQLYETGSEKVSLEVEVEYLKKYIEVQKIRKEEGFVVEFIFDGDLDVEIAPLLLIIPLENAFKYSASGVNGEIQVKLVNDGKRMIYWVENTVSDKVTSRRTQGGLGLENLQKRLHLIYGEKARFDFRREGDRAYARLVLNWDADET